MRKSRVRNRDGRVTGNTGGFVWPKVNAEHVVQTQIVLDLNGHNAKNNSSNVQIQLFFSFRKAPRPLYKIKWFVS